MIVAAVLPHVTPPDHTVGCGPIEKLVLIAPAPDAPPGKPSAKSYAALEHVEAWRQQKAAAVPEFCRLAVCLDAFAFRITVLFPLTVIGLALAGVSFVDVFVLVTRRPPFVARLR